MPQDTQVYFGTALTDDELRAKHQENMRGIIDRRLKVANLNKGIKSLYDENLNIVGLLAMRGTSLYPLLPISEIA